MDTISERLFLSEVIARCKACFTAVNDFNVLLLDPSRHHALFRPAREFVYQAALVSKIIWPPGGSSKLQRERAQARGSHLRTLLQLDNEHPVKSRKLRDHIEHYDERLDAWIEESKNHNVVVQLVGPRNSVTGSGFGDGDIIEHYDPATKILSFRGEAFDMQALISGVADIHNRASRAFAISMDF